MIKIGALKIKCPLCGFVNLVNADNLSQWQPDILLCDSGDGGCDEYFAYMVRTFVSENAARVEIHRFTLEPKQ